MIRDLLDFEHRKMTQDGTESSGEEFSMETHLVRQSQGKRTYYCENCTDTFTHAHSLQEHIRTDHPGARPFPCPECGKTFATSSGLKQHQHIHSSVKPFQCEVCLKAYTQFSNLCRHKRMHADCRQQIKCRGCGQSFSTMHSLNKHKRYCDRMMHSASPLDLPLPPTARAPLTIDTSSSPSLPQVIRSMYGTSAITPRFSFLSAATPCSLPLTTGMPPAFPLSSWMPPVFPAALQPPMSSGGESEGSPLLQKTLEESRYSPNAASSPKQQISSPTSDLGYSDVDERRSVTPSSNRGSPFSERSLHMSPPKPNREKYTVPSIPITPMSGLRGYSSKPREDEGQERHTDRMCSPLVSPSETSRDGSCGINKIHGSPDSGTGATESPEAPLDLSVTKSERPSSVDDVKKDFINAKGTDIKSEPEMDIFKVKSFADIEKPIVKSAFPSPFPWFNPLALMHMQELERMQYIHKMSQFMGLNGKRSPLGSSGVIRPLPINAMSQALDSPFPRFPLRGPASLPFSGTAYMRTGKDKYVCKFCGKVFPRSANLTRHLRTHTGEQPYKCKYCERSFSISSNLQRHIRNIHNKEKPFRCSVCDRCFGQQTNLDRHLRKHETEGMMTGLHSPNSIVTDCDNDIDVEVKVDVDDDMEDEEVESLGVVSAEQSMCEEDIDRWSNISEDPRDRSYSPASGEHHANNTTLIDTNFSITAQIEKQKQLSIEAH